MVIGEEMNRASQEEPEIRSDLPAIPAIVGLRNRIVHGYEEINDELIWGVVRNQLPELILELERTLATRPVPDDPESINS